jgi:hypothetical protein
MDIVNVVINLPVAFLRFFCSPVFVFRHPNLYPISNSNSKGKSYLTFLSTYAENFLLVPLFFFLLSVVFSGHVNKITYDPKQLSFCKSYQIIFVQFLEWFTATYMTLFNKPPVILLKRFLNPYFLHYLISKTLQSKNNWDALEPMHSLQEAERIT